MVIRRVLTGNRRGTAKEDHASDATRNRSLGQKDEDNSAVWNVRDWFPTAHDTASAISTDGEIKNENSARAERKMKGVKGKCGTYGMLSARPEFLTLNVARTFHAADCTTGTLVRAIEVRGTRTRMQNTSVYELASANE
jgi:hypothetical protein